MVGVRWVLAMADKMQKPREKNEQADFDELEAILSDAEESLRRLSQRIHYDAQKWNQKDLWVLGKESYEIYLNTYKDTKEIVEMRYRYSALLFKLALNIEAHQNLGIFQFSASHYNYAYILREYGM